MTTMVVIITLLILRGGLAAAQSPANDAFLVGIYADESRAVTCVSGPPGTVFDQVAWVYVPNELGLAYVTFRFDFPGNIDLSSRPQFNDLVFDTVYTDFADGTVEWNILFADCPSGWIRVFSQQCVLLDSQPSRVSIVGDHSLVRDCRFVLNGVSVSSNLSLNDPECQPVATATMSWSSVKSLYR